MKKLYALLTAGICLLSFQNSNATTWNVTVKSFAFENSPSVVNVGDTIRWTLIDASTHTATSTTVPGGAANWDHILDQFNTTNYYVVTVAGSYTYFCVYHTMMTGAFTAQLATGITSPVVTAVNLFVTTDANNINAVYTIRESVDARVTLTDLSGRIVYATPFATLAAGTYNELISTTTLSKGIYFVSIQLGEAKLTRKVNVN